MGYVHCPFCGARVAVGSDGAVEPKCPRCGAWAVPQAQASTEGATPAGRDDAFEVGTLGATMALESRGMDGPEGPICFVRAPYGGPDGGGPGM